MSEQQQPPDPEAGEGTVDVEELIAEARRPERTVALCVRADLNAEFDELEQKLQDATGRERATGGEPALAGPGPGDTRAVARRIEELRSEMRQHTHRFRLRAMESPEFWEFDEPRRAGRKLPDEHFVKLVSRCAVQPPMSEEQVRRLFNQFSQSQVDALVWAAWQANTASIDVPKSSTASRVLERQDSG